MKLTNKPMKRLSLYLFLIFFTLQTPSQADDIRDFEIEGMSIGDSLLDHFSNEFINEAKRYIYKDKKYFSIYKSLSNSIYDGIQVTVNSDYIIHSFAGKIFYDNNISQCYEKMVSIEEDLDKLFPDAETRKENRKHRADSTGKSTIKEKAYFFKSGDAIQISCNDWSKFKHKITGEIMNYTDELKISIYSTKFIDFLNDENY